MILVASLTARSLSRGGPFCIPIHLIAFLGLGISFLFWTLPLLVSSGGFNFVLSHVPVFFFLGTPLPPNSKVCLWCYSGNCSSELVFLFFPPLECRLYMFNNSPLYPCSKCGITQWLWPWLEIKLVLCSFGADLHPWCAAAVGQWVNGEGSSLSGPSLQTAASLSRGENGYTWRVEIEVMEELSSISTLLISLPSYPIVESPNESGARVWRLCDFAPLDMKSVTLKLAVFTTCW